MVETRLPINVPLDFWNYQIQKTKSDLKLIFRNTSGNCILLIIKWEPSPYQYWNCQIKNSAIFKNLAWDPHSSLNEWVLGQRMQVCAKHLDFELSSCSRSAPYLVCLWSIFVFVSEGSTGRLFLYWNEKIWWELKRSPTGNCPSPWFTSLVFLLTNGQASENWSQPKWGPWQPVWNVRPEISVSQLLESGANGEAGGGRRKQLLEIWQEKRVVLCG